MLRMPPLEGRTALITGGSRGLGRSIAVCLATHGADIGIVGRDAAELERTQTLVTDAGGQCIAIQADLATLDGARAAGAAALAHSDRWDVLVNNAGVAVAASLLDVDAETWDRTMAVNLRAALLMAQTVVPGMLQRRSGKIINVSSLGAFLATPNLGAYAASKAALNALTRTMAHEWGPSNVQANAVCPTVILTDMGHQVWDDPSRAGERDEKLARIPLRRFGEPEDVAETVAFLASSAADYINGVSLPLDGGLLVVP
jgi:2-dehydro-3-deoxy-D-gluconate 5-dehydrogenase